jgi:hypothetical protein
LETSMTILIPISGDLKGKGYLELLLELAAKGKTLSSFSEERLLIAFLTLSV